MPYRLNAYFGVSDGCFRFAGPAYVHGDDVVLNTAFSAGYLTDMPAKIPFKQYI